MLKFYSDKYGNASSLHKFGQQAHEALEKSREIIAKRINAKPEEIIFTSGGTESDNLALQEIAYPNKKKGNHIITTKIEHHAIHKTTEFLEKDGFKVTYLDVDKQGFISLKQLESSITKDTILVSIIHANNEIGTIQDIEAIAEICKKKNVLFHTDAVQSFTKVPIDVKKTKIDLMSLSAHKIHGPKGIGVLYVRKNTNIHPLMHGGEQENKKRPGTENIPGIIGFGKAVELATQAHTKQMSKLRDYLIKRVLEEIPESTLNGPTGDKRLCNNANFCFKFVEGEGLILHLDNEGVAGSTGSACSSHSLDPSHVLLAIGLKPESAHGSLRLTLSRFTTQKEIDFAIDKLKQVVDRLRKISPFKKR